MNRSYFRLRLPMMYLVFHRAACAFCLLLTLAHAAAHADPAANAYLQARHALMPAPLLAAQIPAAQSDPPEYGNKTFEVVARIAGFVTADSVRTVLLSLNSGSLAARLPSDLRDTQWLASGQNVRALVRLEKTDSGMYLSSLVVTAIAPEADISALEQSLTARATYPSRSLPYTGSRRRQTAMPASPAAPAGLSARAQVIYAPYWNAVRGLNPRLSASDVGKITSSILYFSDQSDVDPRLIMAMIVCESGFDINSTSRTGAMGLGQLMPSTARGLGVTNAYDPVQNISASVRLLRGHLDSYGGAPAHAGVVPLSQIALTMAAYNAGPGAVRKYHGVPPYRETQRYVAKVAALYKKLCGQGT